MKRRHLTFKGWGLAGQLLYDEITVRTNTGPGIDVTGYNEADYWDQRGDFLGPDDYGITPVYEMEDGRLFPLDAREYPYIC